MSEDTQTPQSAAVVRVFEATFRSMRPYVDPFNDVDVDVVFTNGSDRWRVPAYWAGDQSWSVRFAPPVPGEFTYSVVATDPDALFDIADGKVRIETYDGDVALLARGALRVSDSGRHFEHADGTPFFWLGDTWWSGLSDRLSWDGFQRLTADRVAKGFSAVQLCAGLVPLEELAPVDPGYRNEGGPAWEAGFERINPAYFDYADRRIRHLVEHGIVPVLVGGWFKVLPQIGVAQMKRHWRTIIARYGAYPVIWIAGGEVYDPPADRLYPDERITPVSGWTEITRYIREMDPYRHPLGVHEKPVPFDIPVQDDSLTDFDFIQPGHFGWRSLEAQVALLNLRYSAADRTRPLINAEVAYEGLAQDHPEEMQRAAFWLAMLNGAAGHSYGAAPTFEANDVDKPFQRDARFALRTWDEGMDYAGSTQVGLSAKLLANYDWWRFEPRPDWITPRGTTLLDPRRSSTPYDLGNWTPYFFADVEERVPLDWPAGQWTLARGTIQGAYAAGDAEGTRIIYIPSCGFRAHGPLPTVLGLASDVTYKVRLWDPVLGVNFDMGTARSSLDPLELRRVELRNEGRSSGALSELGIWSDTIVRAGFDPATSFALLLRFHDDAEHLVVRYDAHCREVQVRERHENSLGPVLLTLDVGLAAEDAADLAVEVRGTAVAVEVTCGGKHWSSRIANLSHLGDGGIAYEITRERGLHWVSAHRSSSEVHPGPNCQPLIDAEGRVRGALAGPGWEDLSGHHHVLLDRFRLNRLPPLFQDWVLVLDPIGNSAG